MPKRKRVRIPASARRSMNRRMSRPRGTAKKALSIAQQVRRLVNKTIENKQTEIVSVNNNISTSPTYYYSFAGKCKQGTNDSADQNAGSLSSRVGNSITMLREKFYLYFSPPATGTITENYNRIRVLLVESVEGNQNLVLSDVLKYHSYSLYGDMVFASPYTTKSGTNSRYKVHMDKTFQMTYNGGSQTKIIKHVLKHGKTGRVINFNDDSATPTDYALSLMVISDSGAAAHPRYNFAYRGIYKDA